MKLVSVTLASLATAADSEIVTWTDAVNVAASPGALQKTAGGQGWNAGAISTQLMMAASAQPQGMSFKCSVGTNMMAGLGNGGAVTSYQNIDFGVQCNEGGNLRIYESGSRVEVFADGDHTWIANDVFKVQVAGTAVQYLKNGDVFYSSATAATFPLRVEAAIDAVGNAFSDVTMYVVPPPTCTPATWKDTVNVEASPGTLRKIPGGAAWNAAAVSNQVLVASSATPQSVSFSCGAGSAATSALGLSNINTNNGQHYDDIQFAVYCQSTGNLLRIHESGVGKDYDRATPVTWTPADEVKVQVTGTTVKYLKNGVVFYTSETAATFPLHVDVSMHDQGDVLTDITICTGPAPTASPTTSPTAAPTVATCTDTPPSAAAVGSSLRMEATAELAVSVDVLEDGAYCDVRWCPHSAFCPVSVRESASHSRFRLVSKLVQHFYLIPSLACGSSCVALLCCLQFCVALRSVS
jgi:hypothetical protein